MAGAVGTNALAGFSIHPGTKVLYAANGAAAPTGLFTLSKASGAGAFIGSSGKVVPCMTFDASGVLYAWDQGGKKLMTLSLSTGAATVLNGDVNASGTGLVFSPAGVLYLKNSNSLYTLNKATGLKIAGPLALTPGGAVTLDNFLVFNSAGTLFSGARTPTASATGVTDIYILNPTTGAATFSVRVPLALTGFVFDTAPGPAFTLKGKRKIKTKKSTVQLMGTASSVLPLTVNAGKKPANVSAGIWRIKVRLKRGKNRIALLCADGMGQSIALKALVIRD